ncbi:hypothetical protein HRbin11_00909 [bacterium HR11]|nr:hypothetical protein HRbin11_00909 [bacterium HR11]
MVRIGGFPPPVGPRGGGFRLSLNAFRQRLTDLARRVPLPPAFGGVGKNSFICMYPNPAKVRDFLQAGHRVFGDLVRKWGLRPDFRPSKLLPFQPPDRVRIMLPTYPPRIAEIRPRLPKVIENSVKKQIIPLPVEDIGKTIKRVLDNLQKRHPLIRPRERLQNFVTELARHLQPRAGGMEPGAPQRPRPDVDLSGPLLASATGPTPLASTPSVAQPTSSTPSVGEQIYGKAKDWWKDPSNWLHAIPALMYLVCPRGWDLGHVITAVRALRELQRGDTNAFNIASKALNILKYLLPPPLRQILGTATSFLNIFKAVELSDVYRDVLDIAQKIRQYNQMGITDPQEMIARIYEDLVDPDVGKWQYYGNLKGEDPRVRFVRALTVYLLASGDEQLTGQVQR